MSNQNLPESQPTTDVTTEPTAQPPTEVPAETGESFKDILSQYEKSRSRKPEEGGNKGREGTVIAVSAESVFLDIGFKTEGILPLTAFQSSEDGKPVDEATVAVKGRGPQGYYE